ncbi:hypothetical protein BHE74_00008940 [Ensete ventricosum]|nr:hypothetical protein GW17_00016749 [Ensete ventricosum]RWW82592.1 hypothetical protein BHE74_00008940 [Ensete ventricosum]RZS08114.1 hypothetical protein BHM03_00039047 [Ensete ventricosum]
MFLGRTHDGRRLGLGKDYQKSRCADRPTVQLTAGNCQHDRMDVAPSEDPGTPKNSVPDAIRYCSNDNGCLPLTHYQLADHHVHSGAEPVTGEHSHRNLEVDRRTDPPGVKCEEVRFEDNVAEADVGRVV